MVSRSTLLILCESSPESYRPAGERVRHLALASRSVFERAVVLTLDTRKGAENPRVSSRVLLQTINFERAMPFPLSAVLDPIRLAMFVVHGFIACRRFKPSFILASMPPLETGLSAWILAHFLRLKLVVDLRDDWESATSSNLKRYFPRRLLNLLFRISREIYSSAAGIFSATQTIAETIRKRGIKTATYVVPNGANSSLFFPKGPVVRNQIRQQYALPLEKVVILYCGSGINPYNRLEVVLSALKALPSKIVSRIFLVFYIYGGFERLESQRRALALPSNLVEIRNPLTRTNLADVMAACDIGLVPFDDKPYLLCARSAKLYEYLSAGLYVISSGPEGGELDRFFSSDAHLGLFTSPNIDGFSCAFQHVLKNSGDLLGDALKKTRHSFIEDNYDRQKIMTRAVGTFFTAILHEKNFGKHS